MIPESNRRPLRIALYEPAGRGGICHYTHQLGEHLVRAGVDVTLITSEDYELEHFERHFKVDYFFGRSWVTRLRQRLAVRGADPPAEGGRRDESSARPTSFGSQKLSRNYPPILRKLRLRFLHLRLLFRFLRRRPDIVHFQWLVNRSMDSQFIALLRWVGIPVVYTAHDVEPHMPVSQADRGALQGLYGSVARIIVHAESNKRELISLFAVEPSRIRVIPHGSYDFLCAHEPTTKDEARQRLGIPHGKRVLLFFGLIKRYKGLEYLLDAFTEIREAIPDAFLLIVGDVFAGDPEGYHYYRDRLETLQDREDVLCIPSYVPVETVGRYLAAADVIALPYTRTFQSGVLLAAYAAGRPVVVTDTGGLSEIVVRGKSGLVVPPRDSKALAAAIIEILADPKRLEAMGNCARHLAVTAYSWDRVAARTIDLYRSILPRQRQSSAGSSVSPPDSTSMAGPATEVDEISSLATPERRGSGRIG